MIPPHFPVAVRIVDRIASLTTTFSSDASVYAVTSGHLVMPGESSHEARIDTGPGQVPAVVTHWTSSENGQSSDVATLKLSGHPFNASGLLRSVRQRAYPRFRAVGATVRLRPLSSHQPVQAELKRYLGDEAMTLSLGGGRDLVYRGLLELEVRGTFHGGQSRLQAADSGTPIYDRAGTLALVLVGMNPEGTKGYGIEIERLRGPGLPERLFDDAFALVRGPS